MSAFEYVSVMASIILGMAMVDLLASANRLVRAGAAVRWDWAVPVSAVFVVLTLLQVWWSQYRPTQDGMTIGQFLPLFLELIILYLLAAAALPDELSAGTLDLRAYYDQNGSCFWSLYTAAVAWPLLTDAASAATSAPALMRFLVDRPIDLVVLVVFASLIFIRRRWWHALALCLLSFGPITWLSRSLG